MADKLAPLRRLEDFDISGASTALLSPDNVIKSEVGTFLSYLQNLLVRQQDLVNGGFALAQNDIFVNKIAKDITNRLGINVNLTTPEMLDIINEFAYDPINAPVYKPSQDKNLHSGKEGSKMYCARAQDAPQEMEENLATARLMA